MRNNHRMILLVEGSLVLLLAVVVLLSGVRGTARSEIFLARSIEVGSALAGATTRHSFSFGYFNPYSVGSLVFEYCSNSPVPDMSCTPPTGLDTSSATLASQTGVGGFSVSGLSTSNKIILNRTASVIVPQLSGYVFDNIVNPDYNGTQYVRVSSYSLQNAAGVLGDNGSVAFSINPLLSITAYVPPYLTFCSGKTVEINCSATSSQSILDLGDFTPAGPSSATSQFSGGTNIPSGYTVSVLGDTMTAGNNIIQPISSPTASIPGTQQFGINVRQNIAVAGSHDPEGVGIAVAESNYNSPNIYHYASGSVVVRSTNVTQYNRFTVSYLVNIPDGQRAGRYASTLSYVAIANL